jgi:hypothetical protein
VSGLKTRETFDFPDHKQWELLLGRSVEGQITWYGPDQELVCDEGLEMGFHVDMLDYSEEAGRLCLCKDLGVFATFDSALSVANEWRFDPGDPS